MATIAKPDSNSDVVAVAFSLARDMCNLRHESPSGVVSPVFIRQLPFSMSQHLQQPRRLVSDAVLHSLLSLNFWRENETI